MNKEDEFLENQEILGGLKGAVERGVDLKEAMMGFYRAGYSKEEIESAAKKYVEDSQIHKRDLMPEKEETKPVEKEVKKKKDVKKGFLLKKSEDDRVASSPRQGALEGKEKKVVQKVSSYGGPKKPKPNNAITVVLIVILLLLLGILAAVFLFKAELVEFFNSLFG